MGARGPKSQASLTVVTPIVEARISVPASCPPAARDEFLAIVSRAPAAAFKPSDADLIVRLATTRVMLRKATDVDEYIKLARLELAQARALRLMPHSRTDKTTAATMHRHHRPSIYETMRDNTDD